MYLDGVRRRYLRWVPISLTFSPLDQDGEPRVFGSAAGSIIVAVLTASDGAITTYTSAFDPTLASVTLTVGTYLAMDIFVVDWYQSDGTTQTHVGQREFEIVERFYFTSTDLRTREASTSDTSRDALATLLDVRAEIETQFEDRCGRSFVPRFRVLRKPISPALGWATPGEVYAAPIRVVLDRAPVRAVRWIKIFDPLDVLAYTLTSTEVAAIQPSDSGVINLPWIIPAGSILVGFEHGQSAPPADLKRAAMTAAKYGLNGSRTGIDARATSMTTAEGAHMTLATPGVRDWITGIPGVDEVVNAYAGLHGGGIG